MKPDTPNPGQLNVEPAKISPEAQPKESNLSHAETTPQPGSSSTTADNSQAPQLGDNSIPSSTQISAGDAQSSDSQGGSFQTVIAQLPAEDSEKIEPEWVDKADEIEQKTSADPYHEEDAQHELSRAYLKKRFGLDIK